jgi:RNA polymerase sigma factor (sigma-70 family)
MSRNEFTQLIANNETFLQPFAIGLTKDNETAKDLVQETFCRAIANKDKYVQGTNLKAWLYTIMRNIFINNYRRKSKQNTIFDNSPNEYVLHNNNSTGRYHAEHSVVSKEIQKAIHNLPVIFKHPFMLYFEGYRYNEIAEMLHEPLGTIKSRIHFARKLLKEQLERF